jgi:hypothetical protein
MTISCSLALRTSTPILRASKPSPPLPQAESAPLKAEDERPSLPAHLAREDIRLDVEHQACACCGGTLHLLGKTVSEMLD